MLKKIIQAKVNIKDYVKETELLYAEKISKKLEGNIYLKLENLQNSGSFKMRGACNKILSLTEEEKSRGIIASSAGNHAQGVAFSATSMGIKSTIVMPKGAPEAKVQATKEYGAEVVLHGEVYDDAYAKAVELQKENDYVFIHPFDDELVVAGQGTIGIEILENLTDVDQILVPIGGGGIIAGIASYVKEVKPSVKIIGVQTANAPAMKVSLENKELTSHKVTRTLADGIGVATPGKLTFELVSKYVDEIITVEEEDIAKTILFLMEKCKIVTEGAGAITTAAMLGNKVKTKGLTTVGIVSGGNIDLSKLRYLLGEYL